MTPIEVKKNTGITVQKEMLCYQNKIKFYNILMSLFEPASLDVLYGTSWTLLRLKSEVKDLSYQTPAAMY